TGDLVLTDGTASADGNAISANGSGNVLVQAISGNVLANANADIRSGTGSISVLASGSITLSAGADVLTGAAGSIDVLATAGSVSMSTISNLTTQTGSLRVQAGTDITVGRLSTSGNASLTAGGSLLDADANGDSVVNIVAGGLRLIAGNAIGSGANAIETTVTTLSARAGTGGVFVTETDGLTVGDVTVSIARVGADALTTAVTDTTQSDIATTANGNVVLRSTTLPLAVVAMSDWVVSVTAVVSASAPTRAMLTVTSPTVRTSVAVTDTPPVPERALRRVTVVSK
ncbi:hypothetical protein, partial [Pseudacidovorax intermedius]